MRTSRPRRRISRNRASESEVAADFRRLVNMSASEIRTWARDPRRHDASFPQTLRELPLLAKMKETPVSRWTDAMWRKARRAVSFIKRHEAQMTYPTYRRLIALRNWGRKTPGVRFR